MNQFDVHRGENPRILFFLWLVLGACGTLIIGLAWRQLASGNAYERIERRQTERRILKPGPRGDIYDRRGRLLVGNRPHYSAVVYLDDLRAEFRREYAEVIRAERARLEQNYRETPPADRPPQPPLPDYSELKWTARLNVVREHIDAINRITGRDDTLSRSRLIRHFNERLLLPLPLVEDLGEKEYARLAEQFPVRSPVRIHTDTARHYPYDDAAAHVLGYVQSVHPDKSAIPDDGIKTFTFKTERGKTGLERSFDERLSGTTGTEIWRVDPLGFQDKRLDLSPPKQGDDLVTSLDIDLQRAAERGIGERKGAAVALDVRSGEVLALASRPGYDLNKLSPYIPRKTFDAINDRGAWLNRAVQLSYPPGSTFKLITAIAGLRHGTIGRSTTHNCRGVFRVGRRIFRCHARHGHGEVGLPAAIEVSCNVFFYAEGLRMGIDVLAPEAKRFGLHERTGIEVPYETGRLVVPTKTWKKENDLGGWVPGDTANTAIGQGLLLVTPLQMATVAASIARDETRTRPTLRALPAEEAAAVNHGGEPIGLSPRQHAMLWEGMERVLGPDGTGRLVRIDGLPIAGKTGTADFRAHGETVNLAWFIGFAPVDDPRIAVAVMIQGASADDRFHGGSTAGPVARDLFLEYREHYPRRPRRAPAPNTRP